MADVKYTKTPVIGIVGKAQSGKTSTSLILYQLLNAIAPWEIKAFAARLKRMVESLHNIPSGSLSLASSDLWKAKVVEESKETILYTKGTTFGMLLQRYGELLRQANGRGFFVDLLFAEWTNSSRWIIEDVRVKNEAKAIKDRGGILLRIARAGKAYSDGRDTSHPSEIEIDEITVDFRIDNNGTHDELREKIIQVCKKAGLIM
jgi:hypothetical protein